MDYNGFTVYNEADDINMLAGDALSVPFIVTDYNGQIVDLTNATIETRFCYSDYPSYSVPSLASSSLCTRDSGGVLGKMWLNLTSSNTEDLGDTVLEYQIQVTLDGVVYNRMSGHIRVSSRIS